MPLRLTGSRPRRARAWERARVARKKSKKAKKKPKKRAGGRKKRARKPDQDNGANLGFEQKLWAAADKLRGHMDAAEYKHVVLGLIFLKYISDAFQERYDKLKRTANADPEDHDEYLSENGPGSKRGDTLRG